MSYEAKEYKRLKEFMNAIVKKRGQSKKAIVEMINLCMKLNLGISKKDKMDILDTLRGIAEGKLFLEVHQK